MSWIGFGSESETFAYAGLLVFLFLGAAIAILFMVLSFLRGKRNPYAEKVSAYECGFSPEGSLGNPISVRFCLMAILFVIFDVEIVLLFPWALALKEVGWPGFFSVLFFLTILGVGFLYEWRSGALEWE